MRRKVISCVICALMIATVFMIEIPCNVKAQVIEEWVAIYDGPRTGHDYARAIAVDSEGNIYVTGRSSAIYGTGFDYVTIKYDSDGNQLWIARYDGFNFDDRPSSIALDLKGNVYVTGFSYSPDTDEDYTTVKYDSSGNELWVARYDGPGDGWDWPQDIALDTSANVYVTGYSGGVGTRRDYATIKYD
ncbi:MAG: SBBP repeat-containing protein, partial [Thermoplasmata archaeon]